MKLDIGKLVNNVSKVTLKGGIFSKKCTVIITVSIVLGLIAYFTKDIWTSRAVILMVFVLAFTMLWKLVSFANKNPQAANWMVRLRPLVKDDGRLFICELNVKNRNGWMVPDFWKWIKKTRL
jgi:hypothetical protein